MGDQRREEGWSKLRSDSSSKASAGQSLGEEARDKNVPSA